MDVNKVVYGDETLIDLSEDTVTPETLLQGATAHNAAGEAIEGTFTPGSGRSIIITVENGAAVTATKSSISVSGTSEGGTCILELPEDGKWAVSATKGGRTSIPETITVVQDYAGAVELKFVSTTLNENDWATIRDISNDLQGENYWSIGDRKEIVLNGTLGTVPLLNYTVYAFIIGFNHNDIYEGIGRIHFQMGKTALNGGADICFCDSKYTQSGSFSDPAAGEGYFAMTLTQSTSGGWSSCHMRTRICGNDRTDLDGTMLGVVPSELRNAVKPVTKYTNNIGASSAESAVTATTDRFFLLSPYELSGQTGVANTYEANRQQQYEYYAAGNSKVKHKHNDLLTAAAWWLRSCYTGSSALWARALGNGTLDADVSTGSEGFSPCFCV